MDHRSAMQILRVDLSIQLEATKLNQVLNLNSER